MDSPRRPPDCRSGPDRPPQRRHGRPTIERAIRLARLQDRAPGVHRCRRAVPVPRTSCAGAHGCAPLGRARAPSGRRLLVSFRAARCRRPRAGRTRAGPRHHPGTHS